MSLHVQKAKIFPFKLFLIKKDNIAHASENAQIQVCFLHTSNVLAYFDENENSLRISCINKKDKQ